MTIYYKEDHFEHSSLKVYRKIIDFFLETYFYSFCDNKKKLDQFKWYLVGSVDSWYLDFKILGIPRASLFEILDKFFRFSSPTGPIFNLLMANDRFKDFPEEFIHFSLGPIGFGEKRKHFLTTRPIFRSYVRTEVRTNLRPFLCV